MSMEQKRIDPKTGQEIRPTVGAIRYDGKPSPTPTPAASAAPSASAAPAPSEKSLIQKILDLIGAHSSEDPAEKAKRAAAGHLIAAPRNETAHDPTKAADAIEGSDDGIPAPSYDGKAHPGFAAVQDSIAAKQGVSKDSAGAILAASSRKASAGAKKANPRLKRVKGAKGLVE